MAWENYNLWEGFMGSPNADFDYIYNLNLRFPQYHGIIQKNEDGKFRLVNDNGEFYVNGDYVSKDGKKGSFNTVTGYINRPVVNSTVADTDLKPTGNKPYSNAPATNKTVGDWKYGDSYFDGNSYKTRAQAFVAARKNGRGVFTYKGKQYNTMQKGDNIDDFRRSHADYDYFLGNVDKDSGGWKPSDPVQTSYKVNSVPEPVSSNSIPEKKEPANTITNPRLDMFTDDDIKNLGFRNYSGLVNAVGNLANANNNFVKALTNRYGADTSKWNLANIEKDLGVKGTYRSFGGGDFGDMSRSMAAWVGKNNGEIDRQNLQDKTGKDGIIYSDKRTRDLFDNVTLRPKENKSLFDTSSFGQNIFGTPKKQQGGQLNMDEQQMQQAFLQYLMLKTGAKDQQQLEQVILQMGEEGIKLAYAQFMQEMLQLQVQAAKFGAKLNYIRQLNGQCPKGTTLQYYKVGGRLCKKCMQAEQKQQEHTDPIKAFKCGRKLKKH